MAVQALLAIGGLSGLLIVAVQGADRAGPSQEAVAANTWHSTGSSIADAISGLALVEQDEKRTLLLAVHDNKGAGEKRLSLISFDAKRATEVTLLPWPDHEPPADLESIARVPERIDEFVVLSSTGEAFAIILRPDRETVTLRGRFKVPNAAAEREFESLDLRWLDGEIVACWADRGELEVAGEIFWATFDPQRFAFGAVESAPWRAPWPNEHQRHLTDIRLRGNGTVVTVASSDPGDAGPFKSAVYLAGSLRKTDGRFAFTADPEPTRLFPTTGHKIEALELVPGKAGGLILGADDENRGGAVFFDRARSEK